MDNKKKLWFLKTIIFYGLSLAIFILSLIVVINTYPILIPTITPSSTHYVQEIHLFYPSTSATTIPLMGLINDTGTIVNCEALSIDMILQYDGVLSEGTPVSITAHGFLYPGGREIITPLVTSKNEIIPNAILVGFDSASSYDRSQNIIGSGSEFPLSLDNVDTIQYYNSSQLIRSEDFPITQKIVWDTQGEYSPYIIIPTHNQSITVPYPNHKIHVSGKDLVLQGEYARISAVLAIVLYFFTLISGCEILYRLRPEWVSKLLGVESDSKSASNECSRQAPETPDNNANNIHIGENPISENETIETKEE